MQFGTFFIASSPSGHHRRDLGQLLEQVELAEELGYSSAWFAEHHSSYGMIGSPALVMAAAAQRTTTLRLGAAVVVLPFHNPIRVAEDYAMVDNLSDGRLNFGVGRGNQPIEYHMMRCDRDTSREVFWESLDIVQRLWAEHRISHHGTHFQFEDIEVCPRPVQTRIPTWVAAVSPDTYLEVAKRGLPIMTAFAPSDLDDYRTKISTLRAAMNDGDAMQPDPTFPMAINTYIAETPERAREEFKHALFVMHELIPNNPLGPVPSNVQFDYYVKAKADLRTIATDPDTYIDNAIANGSVLCTDPDGAISFLRKYQEEVGLQSFIAPTALGGLDHKLVVKSMRLFAEEVMPAFPEDNTPV